MARGVPVAAARATALPETGGDAAEFFDPLDVDDMAAAIRARWRGATSWPRRPRARRAVLLGGDRRRDRRRLPRAALVAGRYDAGRSTIRIAVRMGARVQCTTPWAR